MSAKSLNHVSVHAIDLDESVAFYQDVLGLETIATPTFSFPVQWMRLGLDQFHLFVRDDVIAPTFHHVGLNVTDFNVIFRRVQELGIRDTEAFFSPIYELPDRSVQMYLRDPAGNLIEIDWPDADTLAPDVRAHLVRLGDTVRQAPDAADATLFLGDRDVEKDCL